MNRILLALNGILIVAVGYLFYKINGSSHSNEVNSESAKEADSKPVIVEKKNVPVTGKIAYINIDQLNEKSLFVMDMVKKLERTKASIEASLESLGMRYEEKVKDYQSSASAGILPENEMAAKAKDIQTIERDAQGKRVQMDNLALELNEKNKVFNVEIKKLINDKYAGKYDYVLTYSENIPMILYGNTAFDITKEVIDQMNEDYKNKKSEIKK